MKIQKKWNHHHSTGFKDHLDHYLPTGWARLWLTDFEPQKKSSAMKPWKPCRGRSCWVISSCRWVDEVWAENTITGWWFFPTHLKNMSQIGNVPQFSGWKCQKYLSCHHLDYHDTNRSPLKILPCPRVGKDRLSTVFRCFFSSFSGV